MQVGWTQRWSNSALLTSALMLNEAPKHQLTYELMQLSTYDEAIHAHQAPLLSNEQPLDSKLPSMHDDA